MRTIKFRAVSKLDPQDTECFSLDELMRGHYRFSYPEHYEFNQFTGLLDKNGEEIYEGDVIYFEEPEFETKMLKCEIVFYEGCFCAKWTNGYIPVWDFSKKDVEIIGNIYENPELIK